MHKIEIKPPDISRYRSGNTGVDYVHVMDSGKAGPSVMVQALTHGNDYNVGHAHSAVYAVFVIWGQANLPNSESSQPSAISVRSGPCRATRDARASATISADPDSTNCRNSGTYCEGK